MHLKIVLPAYVIKNKTCMSLGPCYIVCIYRNLFRLRIAHDRRFYI